MFLYERTDAIKKRKSLVNDRAPDNAAFNWPKNLSGSLCDDYGVVLADSAGRCAFVFVASKALTGSVINGHSTGPWDLIESGKGSSSTTRAGISRATKSSSVYLLVVWFRIGNRPIFRCRSYRSYVGTRTSLKRTNEILLTNSF